MEGVNMFKTIQKITFIKHATSKFSESICWFQGYFIEFKGWYLSIKPDIIFN